MPQSPASPLQVADADEKSNHERGFERILVVEDDPSVRSVSVKLLRDQGYEIMGASSGQEAIKQLRDGQLFDLLFTDIVLPGSMNGLDIAEEAKRLQVTGLWLNNRAENSHLTFRRWERAMAKFRNTATFSGQN